MKKDEERIKTHSNGDADDGGGGSEGCGKKGNTQKIRKEKQEKTCKCA